MRLFCYRAIDATGKIVTGQLAASNQAVISEQLQLNQLELIRAWPVLLAPRLNLSLGEWQQFLSALSELRAAEINIHESLKLLAVNATKTLQVHIQLLLSELAAGQPLGQSLQRWHGLPRIASMMLLLLDDLADNRDLLIHLAQLVSWEEQWRRQQQQVLWYPIILLVSIIGVAAYLIGVVLPQIAAFLSANNSDLPSYTNWLLMLSQEPKLVIVVLVILAFCGLAWIVSRAMSPQLQLRESQFLFHLPGIGKILWGMWLGQLLFSLALQLKFGQPLPMALRNNSANINHPWLAQQLAALAAAIERGEPLLASCQRYLPLSPLQLAQLGHSFSSADPAMSLQRMAENQWQLATQTWHSLLVALGPMLILLSGLLLVGLLMAILLPLYASLGQWV